MILHFRNPNFSKPWNTAKNFRVMAAREFSSEKLVDKFLRNAEVAKALAKSYLSSGTAKIKIPNSAKFANLHRYFDLVLEAIPCIERSYTPFEGSQLLKSIVRVPRGFPTS